MTLRFASLLACTSACYSPNPSVGAACAAGDVCPTGLICIDGLCVESGGSNGGSDGGATDAPDTTCIANGAPKPGLLTSALGSNNQDEGNMFDVFASEAITIVGFETHMTSDNTDYEIWTRPGTYVGFADTSAGWTRLGTATFTGLGGGAFTPIPITVNVTIAPGQRQAFYLTNHSANNRYHNGTQVGAILESTPELTLYEGAGINFGSTGFAGTNTPRAWEGKIHYRTGGGATLATAMSGTQTSQGVMFSVTPVKDLELSLIGVNLEPGTHDVNVYYRRGSFAGAETASAQWQLLAAAPGVVSATGSTSTPLPPLDLFLGAGAITSLYVAAPTAALNSGAPTGAAAASNADLSIAEGVSLSGAFAGVGGAVTPNIELGYGACN